MAFPVLNVFVYTAFPITNDRMQQVIADPAVITLGVGTGVALGFELFSTPARTFALGVVNDIRFRLQDCQFDS